MFIRNYNNDGGFFWQIYNILNMLYVCEDHGFTPVVVFDTGLYFEKRPKFTSNIASYDPDNWYNHFFKPLNQTDRPQEFWINYMKHNKLTAYQNNKSERPVMLFDRSTLKSINRNSSRVKRFTSLWHKYISVQPHIVQLVEDFKTQHKFQLKTVLGLHFRGTDKFASSSGSEDKPLHYEYGFCADLLAEYVKKHKLTADNAVIFIATDEEPFIDFMQKNSLLGIPVCHTTASDLRCQHQGSL